MTQKPRPLVYAAVFLMVRYVFLESRMNLNVFNLMQSVNDSAALIWVIASEPPSVEPGAVDESGYVGSKKDGACRWSQMILGPLWRLDLEPGRNIPFRCCAATSWPRRLSTSSADAKRWRRAHLAWGSTPPLFEHARKWLPWPPYS